MVKVQWDRHADTDVVGYVVYRDLKEANAFTKIGKTEKTEFLDKELSDGVIYSYKVSSYYSVRGDEIIGPQSQPMSAKTKQRPKAPANVSAKSGLARKIDLKWDKNEEKDIVEYWVHRGIEDKLDRTPFLKVTANTFTDSNLKDNTKYSYSVKAVDIDGLESDLSNTVNAVTKSLPNPPIGLNGQASQDKIYLKWKPNEEMDIKGYNIYKKGWLKSTLLTTSDQNSCEIKMEEKIKSIKLYITAIDKDGLESGPSEEINIISQ
jgi:chitin-binding protein